MVSTATVSEHIETHQPVKIITTNAQITGTILDVYEDGEGTWFAYVAAHSVYKRGHQVQAHAVHKVLLEEITSIRPLR